MNRGNVEDKERKADDGNAADSIRQRGGASSSSGRNRHQQRNFDITCLDRTFLDPTTGARNTDNQQRIMPQLIPSLALRAIRTIVQRPAASSRPIRTLTTATTATPSLAITSRFNFMPVFRTPTALALSAASQRQFSSSPIIRATCNQVRRGCRQGQRARRARSPALAYHPAMKGVCVRTGITKPKKPNSGERKIARVRLSSGKVVTAIIPGEGMSPLASRRRLSDVNYFSNGLGCWLTGDSYRSQYPAA